MTVLTPNQNDRRSLYIKIGLILFGFIGFLLLLEAFYETDKPSPSASKEKTLYEKYLEDRKAFEREQWNQVVSGYGDPPQQSFWDNSYPIVKKHLNRAAHDPGSLVIEGWGKLSWNRDLGWIVPCEYRAKNVFGAYVRCLHWFVIRNGQVAEIKLEDPN